MSEEQLLIDLLKSNPAIKIENWNRLQQKFVTRKLYWANDEHQWEVYIHNPNVRGLEFLYQGQSLKDAIIALTKDENGN